MGPHEQDTIGIETQLDQPCSMGLPGLRIEIILAHPNDGLFPCRPVSQTKRKPRSGRSIGCGRRIDFVEHTPFKPAMASLIHRPSSK